MVSLSFAIDTRGLFMELRGVRFRGGSFLIFVRHLAVGVLVRGIVLFRVQIEFLVRSGLYTAKRVSRSCLFVFR